MKAVSYLLRLKVNHPIKNLLFLPAYIVLIKVLASLTPTMSVIGETSSLAATRGSTALPTAVAGAIM